MLKYYTQHIIKSLTIKSLSDPVANVSTVYESKRPNLLKTIKSLFIPILLFIFTYNSFAAIVTSTGSGNWNSTTANAPWPGGTVPAVGDDVIIGSGHTVTLTAAVTKTAGTVTVNQGGTLVCNAILTFPATASVEMTISGTVNITVANGLNRNGNNAPNIAVTSTGVVELSTVAATVGVRVWDLQTGSTVKLSAPGNQTLDVDFVGTGIDNLIMSNSGTKTLGENTTVSQVLSIEDAATFANGGFTLTYGAAATLQYKTNDAHTAGAEWITPFVGTGGIKIANTAGSVTMNSAEVLNASVPLTINSGATLATGNFQLTFGGNFINNGGAFNAGSSPIVIANTMATQSIDGFTTTGLVSMTKTAGTATFQGNVNGAGLTINGTGGTLNLGISRTHTFTGVVTLANGTLNGGSSILNENATSTTAWNGTGSNFVAGTGTVNFGGVAQTLATASTFNNLTFSNSGLKTLNGVPTVNGILSMEGIATVSATPNYGVASTLQYKGSALQTTGLEFPTTFNGTGGVIINNANDVTLGSAKTIGTTSGLTLTNGDLITTSGNLLTILNTATTAINGGSTTSYINGPILWTLPPSLTSSSTYIFPVGKTTYLPFSLVNPTTGTGTVTARVEAFNASTGGGGYDATLGSISTSEYWSMTSVGNFTNSSFSASRQSPISPLNAIAISPNLAGTYASIGGSAGTSGVSVTNTVTLGAVTRYFVLGQAIPLITSSVTTLTGFNYPAGTGPSAQQSFTVSGNGLIDNIQIASPAHYEISLTSGSGFQSTSINLPVSGGNVSTTTIYVRLIAGLTTDIYNSENITITSSTATTRTVACSGRVNSAPLITVNPTTLTGFSYTYNSTVASAQQSFTVKGDTLALINNSVVITPPTDFEISTTSGSGFISTPITLTPTYNASTGVYTRAITTIYARMKIGLGVGSHVQDIVVTSTGATTKNVTCNGTVSPAPTIYNDVSILSGFVYSGTGPSGTQTFKVSGTNLTAAIGLKPQANYEISLSAGSGYVSTTTSPDSLRIVPTSGIVNPTTIYVRLKANLTSGVNYNLVNIVIKSLNAITKSVSCNGTVVSSATLTASKPTLTGFGYMFGTGPSGVQSFSVSGVALGTNVVTITPPADYEVSFNSTTGFVPTTSPVVNNLTITPIGNKVDPTTIYVRLKAGLSANTPPATYGPENIVIAAAGSGATSINVASTGKVFTSPLISASATGTPSCPGSTIDLSSVGPDIESLYWSGPNGFYSNTSPVNLATNNSTTAMTGTYTVTGNVVVGGNLVTNGDFESGNISFGSAYGYAGTSSTALSSGGPGGAGEGLYTVVATPQSVHGNFSTNPDHTPAPGTLQMVVNGAPTAGVVVWSQAVPVVANATYQFTYWEQTVNVPETDKNPSRLQLYVNGVAAGPIYTAPTGNNVWAKFLYNASSGSNTVLNLELVNQNTVLSGNDFALDDIEFKQILTATSSVDVLVNPNLPASLTIAATATTVTQGSTVSYTATPTNGGTTPSYQWKVNGINAGTNSSTYSYVPANGDIVTCTMTSSLTCSGTATSNTITMTVNPVVNVNYWRGTNSTDWGTASNWTANYIPQVGEDVIYASTSNSWGSDAIRDLVLDQNRTIGSLINTTAKRLVIPAGKGLTVNNTITITPHTVVPPTKVDTLIYIRSSTTLANGSLIFHNAPSSPVYGSVEMYSKAFRNINAPSRQKFYWQYIGIPITSVVASPFFDKSYVREWHQEDPDSVTHWRMLNNESVLVPFYAYELCQDAPKTFVFHGQLVNTNFYPDTIPYAAGVQAPGRLPFKSSGLYPGQSIFANPYTAAIDIRQLAFGSGTEATVYMYNTGTITQWTTSGGKGTFSSTTTTPGQYTAVPKNTAGNGGIPRQIPSMQAMLVKAMNNSTNATFGIPYSSVAMINTDPQRVDGINDVSSTDRVYTIIDVAGENYTDRMWLFTEPTCKRTFDNGWDGPKMLGSTLVPQLYAVEPDGEYQVNAVSDINNTQLAFQAGTDVEFELTFTHTNLKRYYPGIYLVDNAENKTVDITESGSKYRFLAESTPSPVNRFMIVTRHYEKETPDESSTLKIFGANGMIFVHNFGVHNGNAMIYDISGHFIMKVPFSANGITAVSSGLKTGAYVAKCLTENEEVTKRIIVR